MGCRELVLCASLAACYSPHYDHCALACGSGATCPDGLQCEMASGRCRATDSASCIGTDGGSAMPDGPPCNLADIMGDCDGDGISNGSDNCPTVPNANQDNEDGDAWGDACDKCPPFATSPNDDDADGDGVGDQCDPHVVTPGDVLVLFDGFQHGAPVAQGMFTAPTLLGTASDWSYSASNGGAAQLTMNVGGSIVDGMVWNEPPTLAGKLTISAGLRLDMPIGMGPSNAGTVIQYDAADTNYSFGCVLDVTNLQLVHLDNTGSEAALSTPIADGDIVAVIQQACLGAGCTCADHGFVGTGTSASSNNTRIGLVARQMSTTYSWVLIVFSP